MLDIQTEPKDLKSKAELRWEHWDDTMQKESMCRRETNNALTVVYLTSLKWEKKY